MFKTELNRLELEEKKLAEQLREVCGEDGRETNLSTSSSIFLGMANIYHEKFLLLQNDDPTRARFDMIKLIALVEAAKQRCNDTAFLQRVKSVKQEALSSFLKFLKADRDAHSLLFENNIRDLLNSLNSFRQVTNKKLSDIENPYKKVKYTEADEKLFRYKTEQHCNEVTQGYAKLMRDVYSACISILGEPPCKFSLMGLGSLARQEVTPYSDFESFILVERKNREIMEYFKDLSALAHVRVVSLGETIIPAVGISSIKALGTEDGWYFDAFTKYGVSFDGLLPKASKNPLGPQPCDREFDTDGELINTPIGMVEYMSGGEEANKEKMALARSLVQGVLIQGDETLSNSFLTLSWRKIQEMCHTKIFTHDTYLLLRQDVLRYDFTDLKQSKKIDIKKDLYRGISVMMPTIGILCNEQSNNSFDVIRNLKKRNIINKAYESDLKRALAIVNYLRQIVLSKRTFSISEINRPIMSENTNVPLMNEISSNALVKVFAIGHNFQQYILTAVEYKDICTGFARTDPIRDTFHKGNVYARLGMYTEAIEIFLHEKRFMEAQPMVHRFQLNLNLGLCYYQIKEIEKAYKYFKQALSICDTLIMSDIKKCKANALQCMALCEVYTKNYDKAWGHFQTSIDLLKDGEKSSTTGLAMKYLADDLFQVYLAIGDDEHLVKPQVDLLIAAGNMLHDDKQYRQAIDCYKTAVKKQLDYYGSSQENTTKMLHRMALCFQQLDEYDMAIRNCSKSFNNITNATQFRTQAPAICDTFISCSRKCTDIKKCLGSLTEIISASQKWFGTAPSRITAKFYHARAVICERQGNYEEAIQSYEKELNIFCKFYKYKAAHPIIAHVQLSISKCHQKLGNRKGEIKFISQALEERLLPDVDYLNLNNTPLLRNHASILQRALETKSVHVGLLALMHATINSASCYMKTQQWLPGLDDTQLLNYVDRICDGSTAYENEMLTDKDICPLSSILECILYFSRSSSFSSSILQKFILENINSTKLTSTEKRFLFMSIGNYHKGRSDLKRAIDFYKLGSQIDESNSNSYTCRVAASIFDLWGRCLMLMNDTKGAIQQFSEALYVLYSKYDNYSDQHNTLIKIEILLGKARCWLMNTKYRLCFIAVQKTWTLIISYFHDASHDATQTLFNDFSVCLLSCAVYDDECAEFLDKTGLLAGQSINLKTSNTLANSLTKTLKTTKVLQLISFLMRLTQETQINVNSGVSLLLASSILRLFFATTHTHDTQQILTDLFKFVLKYPQCKSASLILRNLFQITLAPTADRILSNILTREPPKILFMFTLAVQNHFCNDEPKVYLSCAWDIVQHLMRCENFKDAAELCQQLISFIRSTKPKRNKGYQFTGILCLAHLDKAKCLKHTSDIKLTREDILQCIDNAKDLVNPKHVREIIYIEREVVQSDTDEKLDEIWTAMTSKLRKYIHLNLNYEKLWENAPEPPAIRMSETSEFPRLTPDDTTFNDPMATTLLSKHVYQTVQNNDSADTHLYEVIENFEKDQIRGGEQTTASASQHHTKPKALLSKSHIDPALYLLYKPTVEEGQYRVFSTQDDIYGIDQPYQMIDEDLNLLTQ